MLDIEKIGENVVIFLQLHIEYVWQNFITNNFLLGKFKVHTEVSIKKYMDLYLNLFHLNFIGKS